MNIISHNILESTPQDTLVRKKYDSHSFQGVVAALLGSETKVETAQVFRLGKKLMTQSKVEV